MGTTVPVTPEKARQLLASRRARLEKMIELEAPEILIQEERRLIREAIYAVETGELPVQLRR